MRLKKVITDYWLAHYAGAHCRLCGNRGVIDSRGVRTAAGVEVGGEFWCICPNGQTLRHQDGGQGPSASTAKGGEKEENRE